MMVGNGMPIMVPKQDWPIAQEWVREILGRAGLSEGYSREIVVGMLNQ